MKLTVNGKVYEFEYETLLNTEIMAVEKVTGWTFGEWGEAVNKRSMLGITALVWIVRKREEPTLRFTEVEFTVASLDIENDDPEGVDGDAGKDDGVDGS